MKNRTIRSAIYNQCGKMWRQADWKTESVSHNGKKCIKVKVVLMKNYVDKCFGSEKDVYFHKNILGFWKRVY